LAFGVAPVRRERIPIDGNYTLHVVLFGVDSRYLLWFK
jgi:hypothetical protein